ncbi:MAG: methyltransferase domain-containing protein [Bacteriovoracaceae bacterium]|nr:methyltransferase domain-containing protein [Bacteriovoracaceae bacterium]
MEQSLELSIQVKQSLGKSGEEIYETCLKWLGILNRKSKILDFGSGKGEFLKRAHLAQYSDLFGTDIMPRPEFLPKDIQWLQTDLNSGVQIQSESFETIVSLEVIEHLENPRQMIRDLKNILKSKGYLILSTPNNGSIRSLLALIFKGHFVSFLERDYPAHITALTRLDLKRILEEQEFTDIVFDFTPKGLIPGLRGLTWQKISFGLLKGELFSDNIFVIAKKK